MDPALIADCVKKICPEPVGSGGKSKFAHVLPKIGKGNYRADKIKVARAVVAKPANLAIYDLRATVEELVAFIQRANHITTSAAITDR